MLEIKITVSCPDLSSAITALAGAITHRNPGAPAPNPHQTGVSLPTETPTNPTVPPVATPATGAAQSAPYVTATPAPAAPVVPLSAAPVSNAPAPTVPVANAPAYTLDQISRAGAALVDAGKMPQLVTLLGKYGVQAVTQIPPERYGDFATELRGLGARL